MQPRKPRGTENSAGYTNGKMGSMGIIGVNGGSGFGPVITFGLRMIRTMQENKPTSMPVTAPVVLNRFQNMVSRITGTLALAATAKARATRNATLRLCAGIARSIAATEMPTAV